MDDFDEIVSGLFEDVFANTDDDQDMYAVRVVFSDRESEDIHSIVVPWVGYNSRLAVKMRDRVMNDPRGGTVLTTWYNITYRHENVPDRWIPTAAKVVKLAQIPF